MPQQIKFDKYPEKTVQGYKAVQGWEDVRECLDKAAKENGVLTAEFYPGVYREELVNELAKLGFAMFDAESCTISDEEYQELVAPFVTDDRVFGVMNTLRLEDIYREEKNRSFAPADSVLQRPCNCLWDRRCFGSASGQNCLFRYAALGNSMPFSKRAYQLENRQCGGGKAAKV